MSLLDLTAAPVVEPQLDHASTERARLLNEARARLLTSGGAVTIEMLARGMGKRPATVRQWVARHRAAGDLIGLVHDNVTLVPTFQLDEAFGLRDDIRPLVAQLIAYGMDGWAVWDWFLTPNTWLDGCTPQKAAEGQHLDQLARAISGLFQE
jgi:hypothetical protein